MGITIIRREIKADRDRRMYERRNPFNGPIEGRASSVDEAHDESYHRHGEPHAPFLVEGGPEVHQTFVDDMTKIGVDPNQVAEQWNVPKP